MASKEGLYFHSGLFSDLFEHLPALPYYDSLLRLTLHIDCRFDFYEVLPGYFAEPVDSYGDRVRDLLVNEVEDLLPISSAAKKRSGWSVMESPG